MNRQDLDSSRRPAARYVGASLVALLFILFSAGAASASSSGTPLDVRLTGELQSLVVADIGDKIRVSTRGAERDGVDGEGHDNDPHWLAGHDDAPAGVPVALSRFLPEHSGGAPACRRFLQPPLRAPPLA